MTQNGAATEPPGELVDLIAAAVTACPAVAGLHGGRFGEATTYLPGRRVAGVSVRVSEIVIGVIGRYPTGVSEIAAQVRAAVATVALGPPVTVNVEDLALPGEIVREGTVIDLADAPPTPMPGTAPGSSLLRSGFQPSTPPPTPAVSAPANAASAAPLEKENTP